MASACAINTATSSPDTLLWPSPRLSFSRDFSDQPESNALPQPDPSTSPKPATDFEFHLHEPTSIITADELFSNGKLVPFQPNSSPQPLSDQETPLSDPDPPADGTSSDPLAPSPRAPMCASRWKDLLRLKKAKAVPLIPSKKTSSNHNPNPRTLRFLLKKNPNPKSQSEQSMSLPLLPSGSDQEEKEKPESASLPPKIRLVRPVPPEDPNSDSDPVRPNRLTVHAAAPAQPVQGPRTGPSVDSPRLNAAGKVVFERSSSSPGSFTGGPRVKQRGIERSYSANVNGVRIVPVLNVPVCSLRGSRKSVSVFGFERIFKGERRERGGPTLSVGARPGATASSGSNNNKGKNEGE